MYPTSRFETGRLERSPTFMAAAHGHVTLGNSHNFHRCLCNRKAATPTAYCEAMIKYLMEPRKRLGEGKTTPASTNRRQTGVKSRSQAF